MSPHFQTINLRLLLPHQAALAAEPGRRQVVGDLVVRDDVTEAAVGLSLGAVELSGCGTGRVGSPDRRNVWIGTLVTKFTAL